jgi:hypothetical protein
MWRRTVGEFSGFVGLNVHKDMIVIAIAITDTGRCGEVRIWSETANTPKAIDRMTRNLSSRDRRLPFVYDAGP